MRPNATVPRQVNQAERTARNAATSKWIAWLARLHQPFGPLLLGIVALGLIAYGVYSFVEARYHHIGSS